MNVKFGAWLLGAVQPEPNSNGINKLPPKGSGLMKMKVQAAHVAISPVWRPT